MKRILLAGILLSGLVLAQTPPSASLLLEEGQRELSLMWTSSYQHKTQVDEPSGQFDYDCSGFVDYALKKVAPAAYKELPISKASAKRPLAQDFYNFFSSLTGSSLTGSSLTGSRLTGKTAHWEPIGKATDLKPGDLVSWLRPPDNDSNNTGHVMLVRARAALNPRDPQEVLVEVLDSTTSPHAQDSRAQGQSGRGLGIGTIGILTDAAGQALAYHWRGGLSRKEEATPIAFGRLLER